MASEVEVRTFLTNENYDRLLAFFRETAEFLESKDEETLYFDCPHDIRLRKTSNSAKLMFKKGELHDEVKEEFEVNFPLQDFDKMLQILSAIGWQTSIKWLRHREAFSWRGFRILVDDTKSYGKILEVEKKDSADFEKTLAEIKALLKELKVPETPKDVFKSKYEWYKRNWKKLLEKSENKVFKP